MSETQTPGNPEYEELLSQAAKLFGVTSQDDPRMAYLGKLVRAELVARKEQS